MSLVYKSSVRDNVTDIQTYIVDNTPKSTKYFRVSDVPQVLQKGKNLLRITAHPTNLVPGTQVYVDVRDSNGNPIYYEIPDYLENDKSRVISIWVYHDKGEDNTPNGEATITLVGIANVDMDGKPLPQKHRGKLNVKWQTTVTVDRERDNTSEIIFDPNVIPSLIVSQSVEAYQNQPQSGDGLNLTSQTGKVQYIFKGETPIVEIKDSGTLNGEMVGGSIILNNFTKPAEPISNIANPLSSTFFSSSIKEVLTNKVLKPATNFTTSFSDRTDLTHTFDFVSEADYKIQYFQSGSNVNTENKRNFANITLNNIDPITGVVDKIKILHKSDGLPGDFELLNEVEVPFSSSVSIKVPIPSKNLKDPKILKLLYLNSEGSISRTQTLSNPFVFDGDNVYIGGSENLISGSIYISNTLGTGIEIGGASSGFIRSVGFDGQTSASLGKAPGGFVIYSGSGNLKMGEDFLNGVGMQFIGDNDDRHLIFTTDGGGLLDVKTDKFFIGTENTQFISGSDGAIEISSSIFHLNPSANGGDGSLVIGANATINADLTVDNLRTPASIGGVASTETNSSSSIKADGFARFVSASIGGWGITTSSIEGGNLLMKPEGILQTRDFASGLKGWKISSEGNGTAEFENIRIRGTLRTTTFEKESVNAVGGQLWVANSTTITGSIGTTDTTMSVKNASGFAAGEILLAKKVDNTGFQTEYFLLESASVDGDNSNEDETFGRIYVQRAYGSGQSGDFVGDLASSAQAYEDGQVVVSTGKLNTGYIKMNANPNDTATPFIDIVERTGSGLYDVALKARLGDLSGLANSSYVFGNSDPGFGLATDNVYLQGGIIANTGSIGGINMDAGKLFTGTGTYANSNTGFYVDSGSQFSLGNKLVWNPSTEALTIRGQLQLADGTDVGTAIENVSTPTGSVARTVELSADKYVITFDAAGNESPSGQSITLTATPQNFGTATVYYEFYKDSTIQGARSTTNTFTVDNTAEKPTASTPKTYEVRTFTGSDGGTSVTADSLTLFGIQPGSDGTDGQDAVTAFLTNESHTLPLSSSGVVQSYAGADTEMKVFEGVTDATSNYTYTISKPSHITTTQSTNTVTVTNTTTPHSGSVTITATSASVSLSKIMSIGTTRQGDDGTDGTPGVNGSNAKTLVASVDSQVFAFDDSTDNSATPGSILFTFSQQNLNDTIQSSDITITTADSNSVTNFSFDNNDVSDGTGIVSGSISYTGAFNVGGLSGAKTSLPITISCTNDSLTDSIKVFKVEGGSDGSDGADAVTAFLTNESHTLPSQNDGTVVSFSGAETDMIVFEGVTDKTNSYTFSRTSATSVSSSISDNTVTITSMGHDSGSVIITATSASVSLSKTMTLAKSKQGTAGLAGSDAKLLSLTSDSQVFAFPSASSSNPEDNDILVIVNQQNLSGTVDGGDITIKDAGGNTLSDPTFVANVTNGTGQVSGSITFSGTVGGDKTKLPLTIEVSKDSLEDSLKIFKIDGGNEGQDGADAVTAFLTNESHTFAADSTGAIASFTGGSTDMEVFEGITNVTNNYTISKTDGTGVTSSVSDSTVTISAMVHDSGSITINASSGSVSIDKIMSLVKSKQGPDGSDGTSAKLLIGTLDSQVMAFDDSSDTTATPTSVEFSFQQQNLAATIQSSDINISLNGGGNITNFEFNNSDVSNGTGIVSGSFTFAGATNSGGMGSDKSKFPVLISATKDSLQDAVKVFKVEGGADGTDSVQVILSNESHTLAAQSDGTVISFTGADTDVTVFEGITDKTSAYTISRTNGTGVSTTLAGDNIAVTGMTHDSGSVTINAASGSVSINKLMSLTKAKQGQDGDKFADTSITTTINLTTLQEDDTLTFTADTGLAWTAGLTAVLSYDSSNFINGTVNSYNSANGSMSLNVDTITGGGTYTAWSLNVGGVAGPQGLSGANAKNIVASADSQVFSFLSASDNTAEPSSIIFSFNQQNLNNVTIGSGDITITGADGTSITNFTLDANDVDSNFSGIVSGSLSFSANTNAGGLGSDKAKLPVTISATKDGLTDSIKIFKVEGGTAGTDGTDAVTAFLTNEAHTFAAANDGTIVSFSGAFTDMEVFEGTTNSTSNYTFTKSDGTGVTSTISTNRVTISALSSDSGSVDITATSGSTTLTKTMSLVKSKQGAQGLAGDDAKMLTITSDSPVFSFASASSSTALDDTIELIINQQNLSATVAAADLVIKDAGGNTLSDPTLAPSSLSNNTGLVSGSITFSGTVGGDKTKLPLEITITQDGLTDSLKIFKVEGGTGGTDGTDAINGFLSNESHTFPADSTGAIASFTGGTSTMSVFEGVTDRTSIYTYSKSDGTGVTSTLGGTDGNVLTISALGHDSGSVDITATSGSGGGQVSITKTMSLTKARQGSDGSDGTSAKLLIGSLNSQVFAFDDSTDTDSDPSSIEFSFQQQNLSGSAGYITIGSSDIDVRDSGNNQITGFTFDNNDVTNGTGIVSGSITFANATNAGGVGGDTTKLPITITATKDGLTDSVKIFKVVGGADGTAGTNAVTALLTNDSHTLPVSSSGNVISFAGANTEMIVFEGTSDRSSNYTFERAAPSHMTTTQVDGTITLTNSTTPFTGSIVITATSGSGGAQVQLSKTMSISQALQGDDGEDGAPGSDAKTVTLTGDSQVFTFPSASATTPDDNTIELFINQQNLSGTIAASDVTITDVDGTSQVVPTFAPTSLTNGTGVVSGSLVFGTNTPNGSNKDKFPITISVTKDSVSDTFKIFALDGGADGNDGADAYTVFLTNESHTFPAAANGDVDSSDLAAGATEVRVFKGTTQLTNDNSSPYGANTYRASKTNNGITLSPSVSSSQRKFTPTSVTNDSGTATITITDNTTGTAFTKTYTFSKSKEGAEGAAGSDSKVVALTAANNVIAYNAAGSSPSPSGTITLTADSQNFTDAYFKFTGDGISDEGSYTDGSGANQDTFSFTIPSNYFSSPKIIRVGVSEAADSTTELAFDTVTISAIQPGADGAAGSDAVTAILTSEADSVPAASDGTVSSFTGTGTTMQIFEGVTDSTANYTFTVSNTTGFTAGLGGSNNNVLTVSGMSHDSGSSTITATSASGNPGQVQISKVYSVAKSLAGPQGPQGADNQDLTFLNENLTGVGPIASPGLLMTSNVFGFHNGISGTNGSLSDFTSFLDSSGNFYLGGNSSGMSGSAATSGYLAWNNTDRSLLISGSNVNIEVDKFFVGNANTQFISGSNGVIEISGSNFHLDSSGNVSMSGTVNASAGSIAGYTISSTQIAAPGNALLLKSNGQMTGSSIQLKGGSIGGFSIEIDRLRGGSNDELILRQSGEVTGSKMQMRGGSLGGLYVTSDAIWMETTANQYGPTFDSTKNQFYVDNTGQFSLGKGVVWDGTTLSVEGNISVTNPEDFAANTFAQTFGTSVDTTNRWLVGNVTETKITGTATQVAYNRYQGSVSDGFNKGIVTRTSFKRSTDATAVWDVVVNDGAGTSTRGSSSKPIYATFGWTDIDSSGDITGYGSNLSHVGHGISLDVVTDSGGYYNDVRVYENGSYLPNTTVDWESHSNGFTGGPKEGNVPYTTGQQTKLRIEITLKSGGGAVYKIFINNNFAAPAWEYESSTSYGGLNSSEDYYPAMLLYHGSTGKQIGIESFTVNGTPKTTTISGNSISTGRIDSTNVSATAGSRIDLDAGTFFLGGTGSNAKLSWNGTTLEVDGTINANAGQIGGLDIGTNLIESTTDLAASAGPAYKLTSGGVISGSNLYVRQVVDIGNGDEVYPVLDTEVGLIDARNNGRQVVADNNQYYRINTDDSSATYEVANYVFHLMPYETTLTVAGIFTAYTDGTSTNARLNGNLDLQFQRMSLSGSAAHSDYGLSSSPSQTTGLGAGWYTVNNDITAGGFTTGYTGTSITNRAKTKVLHGEDSMTYSIPSAAQAQMCRLVLKIGCDGLSGFIPTVDRGVMLQGLSVIATRELAAATIGYGQSELNPDTRDEGVE